MKKLMLICAPVTSRSGYGAHARDLVNSFFEHDKYDIKIIPTTRKYWIVFYLNLQWKDNQIYMLI